MAVVKRLLPILVLLAALAAAYHWGLQRELTWASLTTHQAALQAQVAQHPAAAIGLYILLYAAAVAIFIPGVAVLTVASGLLFGTVLGAAATIAGATAGSAIGFLIVRSTFGSMLARRAGPFLERMRPGLQRDAFSTVLALRLIPLFPFWLVNIVPALVGVRLRSFVAATALGITPACVIYASIGAGIGGVLAAGGTPDLTIILTPGILLPLLGLALLSMVPVLWRRLRPRREDAVAESILDG